MLAGSVVAVVPPTWGVGVVARYLLGRNGAEARALEVDRGVRGGGDDFDDSEMTPPHGWLLMQVC